MMTDGERSTTFKEVLAMAHPYRGSEDAMTAAVTTGKTIGHAVCVGR
jgi:hypothetical protein